MIDTALLSQIVSQHLYRRAPETINEALTVYGHCMSVLKLWEMLQQTSFEKIGSETRAKQMLAEYFKQQFEALCQGGGDTQHDHTNERRT